MTKHVVNLSGGACSFWAADRVAQRYGTRDMILLFADVLIEDPELYELNERTAEYFGIPITRVSREITPWQLFRREGLIGNSRVPICSVMLKREPLDEWFSLNMTPKNSLFGEPDISYVGLDWTEVNRLADLRTSKPGWEWCAPLLYLDDDGDRWSLVRGGGAVAVTIDEPIRGFQGWRYRWWKYEDERPFPDWMEGNSPHP